ncbi:MAG TPA: heavy-metal-associated domain-containing protein [Saprospiraceae bacterium]|nr:heavy-metal-associated domain-containing protein [Saprospiraceae bacterium]
MKILIPSITGLTLGTLLFTSCDAQIQHVKTETVKVYGNCGMCKKTIEKAGNIGGIVKVDWSKETQLATISFDSTAIAVNEILIRIANAGYDSEDFRAPDEVYYNLHGCCQYERPKKEKD